MELTGPLSPIQFSVNIGHKDLVRTEFGGKDLGVCIYLWHIFMHSYAFIALTDSSEGGFNPENPINTPMIGHSQGV